MNLSSVRYRRQLGPAISSTWLLISIFVPAGSPVYAQTLPQIKTVFVIGLENHNLTQPNPTSTPQQLLGNPAAPYLNSLITPGNSNALQVSFAARYYNAAIGTHPSEPNYVWAEAGTDFGVQTDADPSTSSGNIFNAPHLTGQMNAAGVMWKNYQEDLEYATNPMVTIAGTAATNVNAYYGNNQYYYVARHNPMVFFPDTQYQNVYPLTNLFNDLASNAVGHYNWITPNLYNDQHNALPAGFTYHGVGYAGDQAAIAQGDNFLATVVPKIMASPAYQDHGVIILRWDETEGGDGTNYNIPEIIISPLAKGNAYASQVPMCHSSDVKTMEEIFGLPLLTNTIPTNEVGATGSGCNNVTNVNDLSDLFQPATSPTTVAISSGLKVAGGFQLTFSGPTGQGYEVLATSDATSSFPAWTLLTNGSFTGASTRFLDIDASNHVRRFYTVKSP